MAIMSATTTTEKRWPPIKMFTLSSAILILGFLGSLAEANVRVKVVFRGNANPFGGQDPFDDFMSHMIQAGPQILGPERLMIGGPPGGFPDGDKKQGDSDEKDGSTMKSGGVSITSFGGPPPGFGMGGGPMGGGPNGEPSPLDILDAVFPMMMQDMMPPEDALMQMLKRQRQAEMQREKMEFIAALSQAMERIESDLEDEQMKDSMDFNLKESDYEHSKAEEYAAKSCCGKCCDSICDNIYWLVTCFGIFANSEMRELKHEELKRRTPQKNPIIKDKDGREKVIINGVPVDIKNPPTEPPKKKLEKTKVLVISKKEGVDGELFRKVLMQLHEDDEELEHMEFNSVEELKNADISGYDKIYDAGFQAEAAKAGNESIRQWWEKLSKGAEKVVSMSRIDPKIQEEAARKIDANVELVDRHSVKVGDKDVFMTEWRTRRIRDEF